MRRVVCFMLLVVCLSCVGCRSTYPYRGYHTYAATRKLLEDENAIKTAKAVGVPFLSIPETFCSPVTAYLDSRRHPPVNAKDGHVYLTYIGLRTIKNAPVSQITKPYKIFAGSFAAIVDTLWLPVAVTVDTIYSITRDTTP